MERTNIRAIAGTSLHCDGSNSVSKDTAITHAYINITTGTVVKPSQKERTFYGRIQKVYKLANPEDSIHSSISSVQTETGEKPKDTIFYDTCVLEV